MNEHPLPAIDPLTQTSPWAAIVTGLCLLLSLSACDPAPLPEAPATQTTTEETASTPEQCERDIDNLLDALQPDRFLITTDRDVMVNMLNTWLTQCGAAEEFFTDEQDAEQRATLLPEIVNTQASLDQFTTVDAGYLRNNLFIQQLVESTLTDERTDLERAVALFYKLVRTVELTTQAPNEIPDGPFQSLLFGRGTTEARAWIYGTMLRQLRLDTVIIRPRGLDEADERSLLLGVVIPDEGVYLFDCRLGLPLASPEDAPTSPRPLLPATLAMARENDAIFRQHDLRGGKYPLTSTLMSDIEVLAIGTSSTWAPRFGKLQSALPISLEVYDGLGGHSLQEQGLVERLTLAGEGGLWAKEDIGVWKFPDESLLKLMSMTPEQSKLLEQQAFVLRGPINVTRNPETGQYDLELPVRNLQQARISYIQGDIDSALQVYLRSRLSLPHPQTPNQAASDWSSYWAALAQYDQEDFDVSAESAEHYLKVPGLWTTAAKSLHANALANLGRFDEAVEILEKEPVRAPQHLGNQTLVRRWRRLANGESAIDPELTGAKPPADSDPADSAPTDEPTPDDEPMPLSDDPDGESPPDLHRPVATPDDLPPSDEQPDPRFEEESPADLPPADEPSENE